MSILGSVVRCDYQLGFVKSWLMIPLVSRSVDDIHEEFQGFLELAKSRFFTRYLLLCSSVLL